MTRTGEGGTTRRRGAAPPARAEPAKPKAATTDDVFSLDRLDDVALNKNKAHTAPTDAHKVVHPVPKPSKRTRARQVPRAQRPSFPDPYEHEAADPRPPAGGEPLVEYDVPIEVTGAEGGGSWGDMIDKQASALRMEAPPQLRETEAERASVAMMEGSDTLRRSLPPTRGTSRVSPSSAPGCATSRPLDSRQGSRLASRQGSRGVARPARTAGSMGSWLDTWSHTNQSQGGTMAQSTTAQELFAHGPSKRTAKLAILRRPIWDSSTLLIIPPKHRSRQSIAEDPLQRRNFRPSSYHPRAGRAASLRNTIADRISMTVEQHLADFETPVHYNRWPVRVGDQPAPARDGGGQLAGGGATLSKSAPGEMIHLYKEAAFYQTINGEIKRRSIHDYEWRRRSRMGYSSPPGTGADGSQLLAITGGDLAELPYLSPQLARTVENLQHHSKAPRRDVGSWIYLLGAGASSTLARDFARSAGVA